MIIIDSREAALNKEIYEKLKEQTIVEKNLLPAGDFVIGDIVVERKTSMDLVASLKQNRLWNELFKLQLAKEQLGMKPLLLIEGSLSLPVKLRAWKEESVLGLMYSVIFSWNIPVIVLPSKIWTIKFLILLNQKHGNKVEKAKVMSQAAIKKLKTHKEIVQAMLEMIPDIGPSHALKIMEQFSTLRDICNANIVELENIEGIGQKRANNIYSVFNKKFNENNIRDKE